MNSSGHTYGHAEWLVFMMHLTASTFMLLTFNLQHTIGGILHGLNCLEWSVHVLPT